MNDSLSQSMDSSLPVFVYGTLRENGSAAALVDGALLRRAAAVAMGRWERGGAHFPAATFSVARDEIEGELLWLDRDRFTRTIARLDAYECVPRLFRRVKIWVQTDSEELEAYAYEWVPPD